MAWRRPFGLAIAGVALFALPAHADWGNCHPLGNFQHGIDACSAIIDAGTDTAKNIARAHNIRGRVYSRMDDIDRAISDYDRSIALHPTYEAYFDRGAAYTYLKRDHDRAIKDWDRAIALRPKLAFSYLHRGFSHEQLGNTKQAIADFRKVLELKPGVAGATQGLDRLAP